MLRSLLPFFEVRTIIFRVARLSTVAFNFESRSRREIRSRMLFHNRASEFRQIIPERLALRLQCRTIKHSSSGSKKNFFLMLPKEHKKSRKLCRNVFNNWLSCCEQPPASLSIIAPRDFVYRFRDTNRISRKKLLKDTSDCRLSRIIATTLCCPRNCCQRQ